MKSFSPASALIETLANQGCRIWITGDRLRISDPEQVMTDDLRAAIRQHKPALMRLLRSDSANDAPPSCPVCGDPERWPTTKGPVCPSCWRAARAPEPQGERSAPEWLVERNLNPDLVGIAFRHYVVVAHGGTVPDLAPGALLSRFNLWREARRLRPTTLPVLRQALGLPSARSEIPPAYVARCPKCGGTSWGPSGRHTAAGCEVWWCLRCNPEEQVHE